MKVTKLNREKKKKEHVHKRERERERIVYGNFATSSSLITLTL